LEVMVQEVPHSCSISWRLALCFSINWSVQAGQRLFVRL